jgi:hypothetical protein
MTPTRLAVAGRDAAIRHACAALAYGRHDATALALGGFIISTTEHDCATAFEAFDQAIASAPPVAPCIRQTLCPRTAGARH